MSTENQPPTTLDPAALEAEIATLAAGMSAASARLLDCLRAFDGSEEWARQGFKSTAHWLSWRIGLDAGAAREHVRVARALGELPRLRAALAAGAVSFSKVRAVTRIARPETEEDLLMIAREGSAAQVEKLVRAYRRADPTRELETAQGQRDGRWLSVRWDEHGMLVVEARLPPEAGALVAKAIEAATQELWQEEQASPSTPRATVLQRRADALARVAERAGAAAPGPQAERYQVVVHVDAAVLADPAADGACHVEHGPALAPEAVRRLTCDGTVVSHGRRRRVVTGALRRALVARDQGCTFPGCTNTIVQAHHLEHWANGGETSLDNATCVCASCHRRVHEGGYRAQARPGGGIRWLRPDGAELLAAPPTRFSGNVPQRPPIPAPSGDPLDYDFALGALLPREPSGAGGAQRSGPHREHALPA